MCPYSVTEKPDPPNHMEPRLYRRILEEVRDIGTVKHFTPMLQNEPLVDRDIIERVREARDVLGKATSVGIITNGSLLTQKRADALISAGVNTLTVSIDAFSEKTYRAIHKGLNFNKVVENVESVLRDERRPQVTVRFLRQEANRGEERSFARYWEPRGAQVQFNPVVNRAGILDSFASLERDNSRIFRLKDRLFKIIFYPFCALPFYWLNILWDGRAILCCHDWGPKAVVGDLNKHSLGEVWNGKAMNNCRYLLYTGRSKDVPSCTDCSLK
jgi:MoaA/NifB/PqqE/SkfB family radical SAM enzyme